MTRTADLLRSPTTLVYAAIGLLTAFTLFYHLDDRLLWGDEAETAVLAVNITRFGVPRTDDSRNHITLHGADVDGNADGLWVWSPWADEYVAAASFALFGQNTLAARLPFAVLAFVSVFLLGRVAFRLYGTHDAAIVSMILYATNVSFLLHARQCRYYALLMLAQIVLIAGYDRLTSGRRKSGAVAIVAALTLQFYSNYIVIVGNVLALAATAMIDRRQHRGLVSWTFASLLAVGLLAAPWILYAQPAARQTQEIGLSGAGSTFLYYLGEVHFHLMPLVVLVIPLIAWMWNAARPTGIRDARSAPTTPLTDVEQAQPTVKFCWLLLPCHLLVLCMLPLPFFRYLTPLFPVFMLLGGGILSRYVRPVWLRYALVVVLCSSNLIAAGSAWPLRGKHGLETPYVEFVREILTDYEDRTSDVVSYFRKQADPDDRVLVMDPEFPLIFYTGLRVIDARLVGQIDAPPDWILSESGSGIGTYDPLKPPPLIADHYEKTAIQVHDTRRGASRPDPHAHEPFTTSKQSDLTLYRLRDDR